MNALVINLNKSVDRMVFMEKQLKDLSIVFTKIRAVDGSKLSDEEYNKFKNNWERPLRKSEVGCFLSHKLAWEYIVSENRPFLVLEDDIILSKRVREIINLFEQKSEYEFINLETSYRGKFLSKNGNTLTNEFKLHDLYHNKSGAGAYVMWPSFAKYLLNKHNNVGAALADAALYNNFHISGLYQIIPALAIQVHDCAYFKIKEPFNHSSSISSEVKPPRIYSLFFLWKRFKTQILTLSVYVMKFFQGEVKKIIFIED